MMNSNELDHRRYLVSDTICVITEYIREHDLPPGSELPSEEYWVKELNTSPCIVQESFDLLAGLEIIDLSADNSVSVSCFDGKEKQLSMMHNGLMRLVSFQQIYDIRKTIEVRAVVLASLRRTTEEALKIKYHAQRMLENIDDPIVIIEHDIAFHLAIAKASRNSIFAIIVGALQSSSNQSWPIDWHGRSEIDCKRKMIEIHIRIADAIEAGDSIEASLCMADHYNEISESLIKTNLVDKANEN